MISQKKTRSCLGISMIVLAFLYIYFMGRIAHLERIHTALRTETGVGVSMQLKDASPSQTSSKHIISANGCALTLLYYYISSSLLWNVVIFRKKRRGRLVIFINLALVVITNVQMTGDGYCKKTGEFAKYSSILEITDGESWFDSYSPENVVDGNIRIAFRLHDRNYVPPPDKFAGVPGYKCGNTGHLPSSLSSVLNFSTSISTNLKLMFIGDSITEQFSEAFDAAVLGEGHERNRLARTYRNGRSGENLHQCLSAAAPIRGGGVSAFWRIATLMSVTTRADQYLCEHRWTTWNEKPVLDLLDHRYSDGGKELDYRIYRSDESKFTGRTNLPYSVSSFDAIVMRIPHGWLTLAQITKERIIEAINLSNEHTGAQTVIVSTLGLNNNVITPVDWEEIARVNQMIRDIARKWSPSNPGKVKWVLVQEFGNFTNQILWLNAMHVRLTNNSTPDFSEKGWELAGAPFLLKRLSAETYWVPSISMVCAEPTYLRVNEKRKEVEDCLRSKISRDGAHWCVETLGARYSASIACLLGCVYNGKEPAATNRRDTQMVRQCEQKCNDQFMSTLPVENEWIKSEMTLSSTSI